jgi:hypothetical protein
MPQLADLQAAGVPFTHLDTGMNLEDAGVQPVSANAYGSASKRGGVGPAILAPAVEQEHGHQAEGDPTANLHHPGDVRWR